MIRSENVGAPSPRPGATRAVLVLPALIAALAGFGATASGCSGSGNLGMSDSTYVAAMAGLERLQREAGAPTDQARRDSVMQAAGVTATQLVRAAEVLASQPGRASELWRAIDRRSRETPE